MNKALQKCKENKVIILYSFFLTLLFFGINYKIEYATDTYYNFIQKGAYVACLDNGRPFLALCFFILESLPISVGMIYHIMQLLGIVFLTASTSALAIAYKKYIGKEITSTILSFLTIANPLIIEYFLFEEKGIFMLAILLNVIAALITGDQWGKGKLSLLYSIITILCMLIAVLSYQTSVQVYVVVCLPFIVIYSKTVADFIKKNIYVALLYGFSMGCAFVVAKFILHTQRATMSFKLVEGISRAFSTVSTVTFSKFCHLPSGVFAIWCILTIVAGLAAVLRTEKSKVVSLLSFVYIGLGCIVASFFVFVLNGEALPSPRTVYTYGMIFGVALFYAEVLQVSDNRIEKSLVSSIKLIPVVVTIIILAYEYINFGSVFIDRYQCNAVDRYYAQIIREQIRIYEEESGNKVDTICFYTDEDRMWWDDGYGDSEMMSRAQSCGWSALNSINLYLGQNYLEGEQDEDLAEYFASQNWGMYSEKQVIFRGNELHLCVY